MDKTMDKETLIRLRRALKFAIIFDIVIGLAIIGFTFYEFRGWQSVDVEYEEGNCYETLVEGENRTHCDLTAYYEFQGKTYQQSMPNVDRDAFRPRTRLVDPANPEESKDEYYMYYLFGLMFLICAFVCIMYDFALKIRIQKYQNDSEGIEPRE